MRADSAKQMHHMIVAEGTPSFFRSGKGSNAPPSVTRLIEVESPLS